MLTRDKEFLKKVSAPNRIWQGIPSIEVTKKGRIFAAFYSGETKETVGNYDILVMSDDNGKSFSDAIYVSYPEEGERHFDQCLWIDPLGRLWYFRSVQPSDRICAAICEDPDADEIIFGEDRVIGGDVMLNRPTVLSTGEWLFPMAVWQDKLRSHDKVPIKKIFDMEPGSYVWKSSDNGKTIKLLGHADVPNRSYDEHRVLELKNGVLMMFVRTFYGIGVSYSYDRGKTWTKGKNSELGGPCSRFHITRLKSGRILLVNHYEFKGRNNLTALLSEDEGNTWKYKLLIDDRNEVSYPDVKEADDGYIYIIYDRERGGFQSTLEGVYGCAREILMAKITEEDIISGKVCDPGSRMRVIISKLGKYALEDENPLFALNRSEDRELAKYFLSKEMSDEDTITEVFNNISFSCAMITLENLSKLDRLISNFYKSKNISKKEDILCRTITMLRNATSDQNDDEAPIVKKIQQTISDTISEDVSLSEIASELRISLYYMCHIFKKITGSTVIGYRNELRITKAKKLLIETNKSITSIASECGFNSVSYFGKIFKNEENISPADYRKIHKK